jgi:hypothetical protein
MTGAKYAVPVLNAPRTCLTALASSRLTAGAGLVERQGVEATLSATLMSSIG